MVHADVEGRRAARDAHRRHRAASPERADLAPVQRTEERRVVLLGAGGESSGGEEQGEEQRGATEWVHGCDS
jgi:hypothetical protein